MAWHSPLDGAGLRELGRLVEELTEALRSVGLLPTPFEIDPSPRCLVDDPNAVRSHLPQLCLMVGQRLRIAVSGHEPGLGAVYPSDQVFLLTGCLTALLRELLDDPELNRSVDLSAAFDIYSRIETLSGALDP